ncbi:GNAT family N-acetyltransferase [Ornithinimicrobium faecis]|uniref:GNAT family N-acetyltransferase n=1 Tax=Ornithinimicrobium faecis TaxID=2934158 RepID=A0ABY4YWX9_9MICO|nr:GNAT family N-acetyltransferase [Ornithinimicrobium sp. HY1793]USQ80637.1 GNAT family N-acetyltransferase [Ornithinimicrobium sp. HY1793]
MTLTWRTVSRDDVPAVVAFTNLVGERDGTGAVTTQESTAEMFQAPHFDPSTDTVSAWDGADLVALGSTFCRDTLVDGRAMASVDGAVHPDHREQGIGTELLTRLEARAAELAGERHPGEPLRLRTSGGLPDSSGQRLLEDRGYAPDNYFITMQVPLADWVDPGGESVSVGLDRARQEEIRDAHNDAFRDHRNFSPISAEMWEHWGKSSTMRPEQSRLVVEGERVLAYAVAAENEPGVSHVELVGTRREARGRGLARQVLLGSLRAAREAGCRISELEVDSTSPTGADRLYVAVGYEPVRVISRYVRDVAPGGPHLS